MGANTKIEWADCSFNPFIGCEKVSEACTNCYAEAWAKRTGQAHLWNGERRRTTEANWRQPLKWNAAAVKDGTRPRVFCASLADVFDNAVPDKWRVDLFALIRATPNLTWMLLTKRIGLAKRMLPEDWGDGYPNVWIGATVVTQEEVDRDVPKLIATPARVRFLSCEPLLEALTFPLPCNGSVFWSNIHWIIVGGESGSKARPMDPAWARDLRDQCVSARVAFHFKQFGEYDAHGVRVGKKAAGRELDGRTWDELPQ